MPAFLAPLAISGISALAGLLGNRKKTIESQSTSTQDINQLTAPEYDAKTQIMRDMLMDMFLGRAEGSDNFGQGYVSGGLQNINRGADVQNAMLDNILASRGLARTNVGASAIANSQINRIGQSVNFLNQAPMVLDERNRNNLLDAGGFFSRLPVGQRTTGHNVTNTKGTNVDPGNPLGGAVSSLGTTLAGLYGQGAFGGPPAQQRFMMPSYQPYQYAPQMDWQNYQAPPINYKLS